MAKKKHGHGAPVLTTAELTARVRRAFNEGRSQQALELARQLYKSEQVPAHLELLKEASLARARHLNQTGYTRDAVTVFEDALQLAANDSSWVALILEGFVQSGAPERVSPLLHRVSDPAVRARLLTRLADAALERGPVGRNLLPGDMHAGFDLILQAFERTAAGQDDAAREALQGIGLQSPFLEWKLLVRGLLAWYQRDDGRALENWQRLDPERLPARLAAPLRWGLDGDFRLAQPPGVQQVLQKQADQLTRQSLAPLLRNIQVTLSKDGQIAAAFRQIEQAATAFKQQAPALFTRLMSCFFWAIVRGGEKQDVTRFQRLFGLAPTDGQVERLNALLYEQTSEFDKAHIHWQRFNEGVKAHPTAWAAGQVERVQALVWERMGQNAARIPTDEQVADLPPFLRDHPSRPLPLKPTAEECFRRSLELAPDRIRAYEELLELYERQEKDDKAIALGRQLVERFPHHLAGLVHLADLLLRSGSYGEAIALYERALKVNPLDLRLRTQLSTAHAFNARDFAELDEFDSARAEYQQAIDSDPRSNHANVFCKWAACEFKAKNPSRGEELLTEARQQTGHELPVAYSMLIEAVRLRLPGPLKTRFNKEFTAALAMPPTAAAAAEVADIASAHRLAGITYHGQKTHEKKVLAYIDEAQDASFTETQLLDLCEALVGLDASRSVRAFTDLGRRQFPGNPHFPLIEAESYIAKGPMQAPPWKVMPLLEAAGQLASALPADSARAELLDRIQKDQQMVGAFGGRGLEGVLEDLMYQMGDIDDESWDEGDDWDDDAYWDDEDWDDEDDEGPDFLFQPPPKKKKKKRRR